MSLMETTWLHTFSDGPTSKLTLCWDRSAATCPHVHRNTSIPLHAQTNTHACTLESEILCCSVTIKSHTGRNGGKKSPKCMKKHEAATVSMEQKKQQRKMSTTNSCWFLLPQATWTLVPSCFFPLALCIIFSSN